jgi:hypothetical protein
MGRRVPAPPGAANVTPPCVFAKSPDHPVPHVWEASRSTATHGAPAQDAHTWPARSQQWSRCVPSPSVTHGSPVLCRLPGTITPLMFNSSELIVAGVGGLGVILTERRGSGPTETPALGRMWVSSSSHPHAQCPPGPEDTVAMARQAPDGCGDPPRPAVQDPKASCLVPPQLWSLSPMGPQVSEREDRGHQVTGQPGGVLAGVAGDTHCCDLTADHARLPGSLWAP